VNVDVAPSANSNLEIFATHPHIHRYAEGPPSIAFLPISFLVSLVLLPLAVALQIRYPCRLSNAVGGGDSEISTQLCDRNTQSR
jgi:hypothetical protein